MRHFMYLFGFNLGNFVYQAIKDTPDYATAVERTVFVVAFWISCLICDKEYRQSQ